MGARYMEPERTIERTIESGEQERLGMTTRAIP